MNAINSFEFFKGGNALFTVSNASGQHYTFKIRKPSEDKPFFVSLLTGPDNGSDYTYLGLFNPEAAAVRLTAKSSFRDDSTPVKVIRWALGVVRDGKTLPEGYSVQHEGRCCRCGRTLTTPESIERGIGPECAAKI